MKYTCKNLNNEQYIDVWREQDFGIDRIVVKVPLPNQFHADALDDHHRGAHLDAVEYMPYRSTSGDNVAFPMGPRAFRPRIVIESADEFDAKWAMKQATRIWRKMEAETIEPQTFGQTVAILMKLTGRKLRILRVDTLRVNPKDPFPELHQITEDPRLAQSRLDHLIHHAREHALKALADQGVVPAPVD